MDQDTVLLFTHYGMGDAPADLQQKLAGVFLGLVDQAGSLPAKLLFYTEGVRLACEGSPVLEQLQKLEARGVEIILCKTCLDYFGLTSKVKVGIIGGMPDIIEAMQKARKVISL